ncbi:MAG: hypothetical protein ACTSXT_02140, partial [Candidatus Helarchaeota archaeon]
DTHNMEGWYANNTGNVGGNMTRWIKYDDDLNTNQPRPAIALGSNGIVHISWVETVSSITDIYYKNSTHGFSTHNPIRITYQSNLIDSQDIAVDTSGTIWIAFINNSGVYVAHGNGFGTFTTDLILNASNVSNVRVDAHQFLHLVFQSGTGNSTDIYYTRSTATGFTSLQRITPVDMNFACINPAIAVDNNEIPYIVFEYFDMTTTNSYEIYYSRNFEHPYKITSTTADEYHPDIDITSDYAVVVVYEKDIGGGNENIFCKVQKLCENFQQMFYEEAQLTTNQFSDNYPRVAVDNQNRIHVIWEGHTGPSGNNINLFYNCGTPVVTTTTTRIPGFTMPLLLGVLTTILLISNRNRKKLVK